MTLTQLRYFLKVAELGSYQQAADSLLVSQPSLSAAISSLEKDLGIRLFEKDGRSIRLTKTGKAFYEEIFTLLGRLDRVVVEARHAGTIGRGHIDLGYIPPLAYRFIPEVVRAFLKVNPHVHFGFRELPTRELLEGVQKNKYDVVFCIDAQGMPDIEFIPIREQELVAIVPQNHPLAEKDAIYLRELEPYPVVTYMPHTQIYKAIMGYIEKSGWIPNIFCDATTELSIGGLVDRGFGVSVVADCAVLKFCNIKRLHLLDGNFHRQIYLAYNKTTDLLPSVKNFLQFAREYKGGEI